MDRETAGGWVYIMADRYRGTMYVGVTSDLPARISQHRAGDARGAGSDFCERYGLRRLVWADRFDTVEAAIAHEKRLKRWQRRWKFELIEKNNSQWDDLFASLV